MLVMIGPSHRLPHAATSSAVRTTGVTLERPSRENPGRSLAAPCHDVEVTGPDTRELRATAPLLLVSAVVVMVTIGFARGFWAANLHNGLLALAFVGVGAYVLFQRPGHRLGVLLAVTGVVEAVLFLGRQVAHTSPAGAHPWWAWWGVWPVVVALALVTVSVLCFPDGHLPSPRWRWVVAAIVVVTAVCATLSALWPVEYAAAGVRTEHPFDAETPAAVDRVWSGLAHPAYVVFQLLWLVAVVARWRTAGGLVRRQLAWLGLAAGCSALVLVVGLAGWGSPAPGILAATAVPLAAGWAIVHGQHLASYRALTWLSRSEPHSEHLPDDFARAVADALAAPAATLWMGDADHLEAVGGWPEAAAVPPTDLAALGGEHRPVLRGAEIIGALGVDRRHGSLTLAEDRLLDDLAAQAALVIAHQSLADVIARHRRAGHLDGLSERERDVLELLARGLSNTAISQELHLSIKTVEPVVSTIFTKLGFHADRGSNRRVLAALAYLRS
jgi:DNA-binding CsgD family transcriptional regulator